MESSGAQLMSLILWQDMSWICGGDGGKEEWKCVPLGKSAWDEIEIEDLFR